MSSLTFGVIVSLVFCITVKAIYGQTCPGGTFCLEGNCPIGYTCDADTDCCFYLTTTTKTSTTSTTTAAITTTTLPSFICQDVATQTECNSYLNYCSNPNYTALLSKYCRKTCGMCGSNCRDQSAKCPTYVTNGFCTEPFYKNDVCYCAVSCGVCNKSC